jgi:hypothetical protein
MRMDPKGKHPRRKPRLRWEQQVRKHVIGKVRNSERGTLGRQR